MAASPVFLPKLITCLRGYTRAAFLRDSIAGLTVGVVALPLALAFGIASVPEGVAREVGLSPPVMGLVTAVVAGFLISALGGSRVAIGGPTGAFVVIVYAIAAEHGYAGLATATLLAGIILIALGLTRMGAMIKYIPYPVTTGFTSGIAVIIFAGQIKDLLGMSPVASGGAASGGASSGGDASGGDVVPPEFLGKVEWYFAHANTIDWPTAALGVICAVVIFLWPKLVTRRIPGPIVVMVAATAVVHLFKLPIETIHDRFGAIPAGLPAPRLPDIDFAALPDLIGPAFTIAILAAIESLLCAVVADGMLGTKHRSNTELIAQGVANLAVPLFGGIPATGAIARTATNVQSGGRTPVAGIIHALTLLVIIVALGKYAGLIPLSALAAVLVVVAWNMSEIQRFKWLLTGPRSDVAVLLTTFGLTVLTDLTIAVQVGMVLAAMLFIKRMADVTNVGVIKADLADSANGDRAPAHGAATGAASGGVPPGVEVYEINGPFFFGAASKLREVMDQIGGRPKVLIIDMPNVTAIDATGLHALEEMRRKSKREGTSVILAGVHAQPLFAMTKAGLLDAFGEGNVVETLPEALDRAEAILGLTPTAPRPATEIAPL